MDFCLQLLRSCGLKSIWDWKSTNVDDKEKDTANEEIFTTWKFRTCDEGIETEVKRVIDYIW